MRTLIIGLDAFDPGVFERLSNEGKLPHLTRFADSGGYSRFQVANPPQSEVSWTSIATGLNPGGHGIFDFVHRDPANYGLSVSLLRTKSGAFGTQFVPPHNAKTLFDSVADRGYRATVLWWPATFPARPQSPVRSIPGLGTPDIQGRLGVGTLFVEDSDRCVNNEAKIRISHLKRAGKGRYLGLLGGPEKKTRQGTHESTAELRLELIDDRSARLSLCQHSIDLTVGQWSPVVEIEFKLGLLVSLQALTRVILTSTYPEVRLYALPVQLHPLHSPWRYGTPGSFLKETWRNSGPFLTIGWPQDTAALEEGCITDEQFLALCSSVDTDRERVVMREEDRFDEGVLAAVFDSLDRIQHMYSRSRPDIVADWYGRLDRMIGKIAQRLTVPGTDGTTMLIVSDHGFSTFDFKAHVNRWLLEHGYLASTRETRSGSLSEVDWSRTKAYAIGLNGIYLNLMGREAKGQVPSSEYFDTVGALRSDLLNWRGPDGREVVQRVYCQDEAFEGPLASFGPDLVVGFAPGYRASSQTGLGKWQAATVEANSDHWHSDHCIDVTAVPGAIFSNRSLRLQPQLSYRDFPVLATGEIPGDNGPFDPSVAYSDEDQATVEERLKGLGYL